MRRHELMRCVVLCVICTAASSAIVRKHELWWSLSDVVLPPSPDASWDAAAAAQQPARGLYSRAAGELRWSWDDATSRRLFLLRTMMSVFSRCEPEASWLHGLPFFSGNREDVHGDCTVV